MSIISLLKAVLSLASFLAKYLHDKQLLEAGEYKAIAENLSNANEKAEKADAARRAARKWPSPDELRGDENNTD